MSNFAAAQRQWDAMTPADDPPSIYDDVDKVRDVLIAADIPDYLACVLADVAMRNWSPEAWADALRDVKRHVAPILAEADA